MAALYIRLSIRVIVCFYYITRNQLQLTINILSVEIKCVYLPPDINLVLLFRFKFKSNGNFNKRHQGKGFYY
jgi:hypothetical protein